MSGRGIRRWQTALIAGVLVVGAAGAISAVFAARRIRANRTFEQRLAQIDEQLAGGYAAKAESSLLPAASLARSERNWLALLKRATVLARRTGEYGTLLRVADAARERIPGSRKLDLLARYAHLRTGSPLAASRGPAEAAAIDLQYLQAEEWERRGTPAPASSTLAPEISDLLAREPRQDPSHLSLLAARWQDQRLQLAAGLRWLAAGDATQAWQTLRGLPDRDGWRELKALAAYDAGEDALALELLAELPESEGRADFLLLRGDLLRLLERDEEAAALYQRAIAGDPRYFWSPYLNLARIVGSAGELQGAADLYRKAHLLFPDDETPAIAFAENRLAAGEPELAAETLENVLSRNPASRDARRLLLELQRDVSLPRRLARLQELFAADPRNASLCQLLAFSLLVLGDGRGAEDVLNRYPGGGEPWFGELRGLAAAVRGDLTAAAELLHGSLQARPDGRVRYNLATVLAAAGRPEEAVQELMLAAEELSPPAPGAGDRRQEAQVRAKLAELFLRTGGRSAARRESVYALELDPANGRALLILRTLEAE